MGLLMARFHAMRLLRNLELTVAAFLILGGAFILVGDILFIDRYGVDYNEVAFVGVTGSTVDWPTGERPLYAYFPAWSYGVVAWLLAAVTLLMWWETRAQGAIVARRGTE
jgi:hypothetical protein